MGAQSEENKGVELAGGGGNAGRRREGTCQVVRVYNVGGPATQIESSVDKMSATTATSAKGQTPPAHVGMFQLKHANVGRRCLAFCTRCGRCTHFVHRAFDLGCGAADIVHSNHLAGALPPPSGISTATSELYPFVFFTLRAHSNDSATCSL